MNAHRGPDTSRNSPVREILEHTATTLLDVGISKQQLLGELQDILRHKPDSSHLFDPARSHDIIGYTQVIAHWYTDPDFRDRRAVRRPAALPLNGRQRSVAALIRRVFPRQRVAAIAATLIALGAIRRHGRRYVPNAHFVSFSTDPAVAHVHAFMTLLGHMRTIAHNLACDDETRRLFERAATNARVPVRALPTIHRHISRVMGDAILRLDAYFSRWEARSVAEPTTLIGAAAFAFDDATIPGHATLSRGRRRTRAKRGSRHRRAERTP